MEDVRTVDFYSCRVWRQVVFLHSRVWTYKRAAAGRAYLDFCYSIDDSIQRNMGEIFQEASQAKHQGVRKPLNLAQFSSVPFQWCLVQMNERFRPSLYFIIKILEIVKTKQVISHRKRIARLEKEYTLGGSVTGQKLLRLTDHEQIVCIKVLSVKRLMLLEMCN